MAFFMFWYTFDDHLAVILGIPALGHVPLWVAALIGCALSNGPSAYTVARKVREEMDQ